MSDEQSGTVISDVLAQLGPRVVEGDFGRVSMHSVNDAIAADEYSRKKNTFSSRSKMAGMLRSMNYRLMAHDGPGS